MTALARTPAYAARADAEQRAAELETQAKVQVLRAKLQHLLDQEDERAGAAMQRWPEVSRLVSITRALLEATDHVPELLALRDAARAALAPFNRSREEKR